MIAIIALFICSMLFAVKEEELSLEEIVLQQTIATDQLEERCNHLDQQILDALQKKHNTHLLRQLLEDRLKLETQIPIVRGSKREKKVLKEAQDAAQKKLESAEKNLTWSGSTSRRAQLVAGVCATIIGFGNGIYHLFELHDNKESSKWNNYLTLFADGFLATGGIYNIKLAIHNSNNKDAYNDALIAKMLVEQAIKTHKQQKITRSKLQEPSLSQESNPEESGPTSIHGASDTSSLDSETTETMQ